MKNAAGTLRARLGSRIVSRVGFPVRPRTDADLRMARSRLDLLLVARGLAATLENGTRR